MTNAIAAFRKSHAANDRFNRAVNRLNWLNCGKGPDAFVVHADALSKIEAEAKAATAEWTEIGKNLTAAEVVAVMTAN
jgi:hypothetical protein